jgi:hypothetical protein
VSWNKVGIKGVVEDQHVHWIPKPAGEEDRALLTEAEPTVVFLRRYRWVPCGSRREAGNRLSWVLHVLSGRINAILLQRQKKRRSLKK